MSYRSSLVAMWASQGKQIFFDAVRLLTFRANRLAEPPCGWQNIRQVINQDPYDEPQENADDYR
jgi:hypothetical protein